MIRFRLIALCIMVVSGSIIIPSVQGNDAQQPVATRISSPIDRLIDAVIAGETNPENIASRLNTFRRLIASMQKRPNLSPSRKYLLTLIDTQILERMKTLTNQTTTLAPSGSVAAPQNTSPQIAGVLSFTNAERRTLGVADLMRDSTLDTIAQRYAEQMKRDNTFAHEGKDGSTMVTRVKAGGYSFRALAENLAMGVTDPQDVVELWMQSPGHKKNLINPTYTHIGLGYVDGYRVQVFALPQ